MPTLPSRSASFNWDWNHASRARRPNRTAAQRRAQRSRAEARTAQRLLAGFTSLTTHRGCRPSKLGAALAQVLVSIPTVFESRAHEQFSWPQQDWGVPTGLPLSSFGFAPSENFDDALQHRIEHDGSFGLGDDHLSDMPHVQAVQTIDADTSEGLETTSVHVQLTPLGSQVDSALVHGGIEPFICDMPIVQAVQTIDGFTSEGVETTSEHEQLIPLDSQVEPSLVHDGIDAEAQTHIVLPTIPEDFVGHASTLNHKLDDMHFTITRLEDSISKLGVAQTTDLFDGNLDSASNYGVDELQRYRNTMLESVIALHKKLDDIAISTDKLSQKESSSNTALLEKLLDTVEYYGGLRTTKIADHFNLLNHKFDETTALRVSEQVDLNHKLESLQYSVVRRLEPMGNVADTLLAIESRFDKFDGELTAILADLPRVHNMVMSIEDALRATQISEKFRDLRELIVSVTNR
jgi:hypothetical protein